MTEAEWLACDDLDSMIDFAVKELRARSILLFGVAFRLK